MEKQAINYFKSGYSCSESVIRAAIDEGLCDPVLLSCATSFSGGISSGCLCGTVAAAQMILGFNFGRDNLKNNEICAREKAKEFIVNPYDDEKLPEKHRKNIPLLGDCMITEKHVISVQNDVGTSYKAYIDVQNELVAAYNELRDELGKAKFGKTYAQCDEDEQKAIREYYPQKISEAEPKKYGGK